MKTIKMIIASIFLSFLFLGCEKEEKTVSCECTFYKDGVRVDEHQGPGHGSTFEENDGETEKEYRQVCHGHGEKQVNMREEFTSADCNFETY